MAVPKIDKHKQFKKNEAKRSDKAKCGQQFPDCPETPDITEISCKLCPYNHKLKQK